MNDRSLYNTQPSPVFGNGQCNPLQIRVWNETPYRRYLNLYAQVGEHYAESIVWKKAESDGVQTPPIAQLPIQSCQQLMDDLWSAGVRPTEGTGSAGALQATQDHLKDMQRLVFERNVCQLDSSTKVNS